MDIKDIIVSTDRYNLHSHTQFCDGRFPMDEMAESAAAAGMLHYGFSPHSPICCESGCNMSRESVPVYLDEAARLRDMYAGTMSIMTSMEIDFISADFGPHIDYFQKLPLDYAIGSVHFVPTRDGVPVDCDGRFPRFAGNLEQAFDGDIRYVVEKYFEHVLMMQERGGFGLLGHFDKIAGNASQACEGIEEQGWYEALVDDVISHAVSSGTVVEINTKAYEETGRFFPAVKWWPKLVEAGVPVAIDSDAHYRDRINSGREQALTLWRKLTANVRQ